MKSIEFPSSRPAFQKDQKNSIVASSSNCISPSAKIDWIIQLLFQTLYNQDSTDSQEHHTTLEKEPAIKMHLYKRPSGASRHLKLHEAALIRHQQKSISSPTEHSQRSSDLSSCRRLSFGNIFQEGSADVPVVYLSEHHFNRLQELREERLSKATVITTMRNPIEESGVGNEEPIRDRKLCRIKISLPRTSISFPQARKSIQKHFQNFNIRSFPHQSPRKRMRKYTSLIARDQSR